MLIQINRRAAGEHPGQLCRIVSCVTQRRYTKLRRSTLQHRQQEIARLYS